MSKRRKCRWRSGTLPGERWMPIVGYEGLYEISDAGRVVSLLHARPREIGSLGSRGYMRCLLNKNEVVLGAYIHRLVLIAFVGPCPNGMECAHYDGDKANNTLRNLRWATGTDNHKDKRRHGNVPSTLTENDVRDIRYSSELYRILADKYKVSKGNISMIKSRKAWGFVND